MRGSRERSARWLEARLGSGQGEEWLVHRGWSMAPALRDGDQLRVAPFAGARPRVGEVVLFSSGSRLVAHRLVAITGDLAVTRGDACRMPDPPAKLDSLLGRVVEVRRRPWLARLLARWLS